jgi:hypothetical protein
LCIVGTCFNTTATNTGRVQGTAVAVEKYLGDKLLYLACRHHVHELVLREVWEMLFGKDQRPTYTPFKNLQSTWAKLDKTSKSLTRQAKLLSQYCHDARSKKENVLSPNGHCYWPC